MLKGCLLLILSEVSFLFLVSMGGGGGSSLVKEGGGGGGRSSGGGGGAKNSGGGGGGEGGLSMGSGTRCRLEPLLNVGLSVSILLELLVMCFNQNDG